MSGAVAGLAWPLERLAEAIDVLGASGERGVSRATPPTAAADAVVLDRFISALARSSGLEADGQRLAHADVDGVLRQGGPALVRLPGDGPARFLVVSGGRGRRLEMLAPDLGTQRVATEEVRAALCAPLEGPIERETQGLLDEAGIEGRRRTAAARAIREQLLADEEVEGLWLLSRPPSAGAWEQLGQAGLTRRLALLLLAHAAQLVAWLAAWWLIGRAALQGRLDGGWLLAWGLVLLTLVPLRSLGTWSGGLLAIGASGLLKQRLLLGSLRLRPEEVRHEGAGELLGRVLESEAVEALALNGGFLVLISAMEMTAALAILGLGAGGGWHVVLLLAWMASTVLLARAYLGRRRAWTRDRLGLTRDLVEKMVGHRTRLAQQEPALWHEGEDRGLERSLESARRMDRAEAWLATAVPRGWLLIGSLGLAPAFVSGEAGVAGLAIGLGGMLLAHQAFFKLGPGLAHLAGAVVAWEQVSPLWHAGARQQREGDPAEVAAPPSTDRPRLLLSAREIGFSYPGRAEPVLSNVSLSIERGDRLLLEGESGGGKSTLTSLLAGLRRQDSGLLLLDGVDRPTLGLEGWRLRVVTSPQFHENHVVTGPFAFNLLMGRSERPTRADVDEAVEVCHELGLGELLSRMPGGLMQLVGETGWQLSHGEKSRLFLARALLQGSELVVLDESFAALDPETLRRCLDCARSRARTLLVVAHP